MSLWLRYPKILLTLFIPERQPQELRWRFPDWTSIPAHSVMVKAASGEVLPHQKHPDALGGILEAAILGLTGHWAPLGPTVSTRAVGLTVNFWRNTKMEMTQQQGQVSMAQEKDEISLIFSNFLFLARGTFIQFLTYFFQNFFTF